MLHKLPGANTTTTFQQNCIYEESTELDNDLQAYIPYSEIHDEDKDEETKFIVIFATKRTLSFLNQGDTLHIDATYRLVYILKLFTWSLITYPTFRLVWNGFPVIVCGVTGKTGKFHGSFSVLAHDEKAWTWNKVYT